MALPRTVTRDTEAMLREFPRYLEYYRIVIEYMEEIQQAGVSQEKRILRKRSGNSRAPQEKVVMAKESDQEYLCLKSMVEIINVGVKALTRDQREFVQLSYWGEYERDPREVCGMMSISLRTYWRLRGRALSCMAEPVARARILAIKLARVQDRKRQKYSGKLCVEV